MRATPPPDGPAEGSTDPRISRRMPLADQFRAYFDATGNRGLSIVVESVHSPTPGERTPVRRNEWSHRLAAARVQPRVRVRPTSRLPPGHVCPTTLKLSQAF